MPQIQWVLYRERVVARNSPAYEDVDNRPLRQVIQIHGWDPDDALFTGLHHFPLGAYVDDIFEQVAGTGLTIHNKTTIAGVLDQTGDVTLHGGVFAFSALGDFDIHLATHKLNIDGGDIHLTGGRFFGDLDTVVIKSSFTVDAGTTYIVNANAIFNGNVTLNSQVTLGANGELDLPATFGPNPLFPYTTHKVAGNPFLSLDATHPGAEVVETFGGPGGWRVRKNNGSNSWMEVIDATDTLKVYFAGGIDFSAIAETGWSLGSGGTQKGGLVAGTSSLTVTQQVVNSLVALLLTKHKLAQP